MAKKKIMSEEQAAKKAARMEALKNRPEGQRCNSRQVDVIEIEGSGKVLTYGYSMRKTGTLVTSVALNPKGEIVAVSTGVVLGTKVKAKKGHGNIVPGVAGIKISKASADMAEEDEDTED